MGKSAGVFGFYIVLGGGGGGLRVVGVSAFSGVLAIRV